MSLRIRSAPFITFLVLFHPLPAPAQVEAAGVHPSRPTVVAFTDVAVVPMDRDTILEARSVLVRDGRITDLGPSPAIPIPDEAEVIDGRGKYLIPGLADMHAHMRRKEGQMPEDYLRNGITFVRNMQGEPSHLEFRDRVLARGAIGPLMTTAGPALAGTLNGKPLDRRHRIVETAEEGRRAVREQVEAGYDYIKVYSFLNLETYEAILDEARKQGIPVIGHVSDNVPVSRAIAAGQSSIEHLYGYFWELESDSSELRGEWAPRRLFHAVEIDPAKLGKLAALTAESGVWNCPTVWRKDHHLTSPLAREAWENRELRDLGERNRRLLVRALHDAGAGLLAGTDDRAEVLHDELAIFVEAGLTPYEALLTATADAARYLGALDDFGTVEIGKRANLVLLDGNPLRDITRTRAIVGVMMNGVWLSDR
jgi:imidazolonepropionase-like amidohydrolase